MPLPRRPAFAGWSEPAWALRRTSQLVIVCAVYFTAAKLGLQLAFVHASSTAVWPPTGIALAALLLLGDGAWPAIAAAAFLANITTHGSAATCAAIGRASCRERV